MPLKGKLGTRNEFDFLLLDLSFISNRVTELLQDS